VVEEAEGAEAVVAREDELLDGGEAGKPGAGGAEEGQGVLGYRPEGQRALVVWGRDLEADAEELAALREELVVERGARRLVTLVVPLLDVLGRRGQGGFWLELGWRSDWYWDRCWFWCWDRYWGWVYVSLHARACRAAVLSRGCLPASPRFIYTRQAGAV